MHLKHPEKEKRISLRGAVQINHSSFFVCKDGKGKTFLDSGKDEQLHKSIIQNMIESNPFITKILRRFRIKC